MMRGLSLSEQHQKLLLDRSRAGGMSMALLDPVLNINSTRGHCTSIRQDGVREVLLTGPAHRSGTAYSQLSRSICR